MWRSERWAARAALVAALLSGCLSAPEDAPEKEPDAAAPESCVDRFGGAVGFVFCNETPNRCDQRR